MMNTDKERQTDMTSAWVHILHFTERTHHKQQTNKQGYIFTTEWL